MAAWLVAHRPQRPAQRARRFALGLCTVALSIAAAGCLAFEARAQDQPSRRALIVGVSIYAAPEVPRLVGVPFDMDSARAVAKAMGIADAQTTVLRDAQATKAGILDALEALADSIGEGSRVFVYFSGHGTRWYEPALQGCKEGLLAYDRETITNEEIALRTRRMSAVADKVVVLFDACFSDGVSTNRARTRAIARGALTPKFFLKTGVDAEACSRPSNLKSRGLMAESTRLGALSENFVQITSSRADEVSFDEPGKGGIATQGVRDCLLGRAVDRDASGAVSISEVEQCAQAIVEQKLKPFTDLKPNHITVTGNRNLVPVAASRPAAALPPAQVTTPAAPPAQPAQPPPLPATPAAVPSPAPVGAAPPPPPTLEQPPRPAVEPALASVATLRDIDAQRNPRRQIEVSANPTPVRIGRDSLQLTVRPNHDGYLYLVLLGSDRKSFYLLFPNGLDRDNAVRANSKVTLPRPGWNFVARGPAGTDHLLVLVSDTPRDLAALSVSAPDSAAPFTFALNDLPGRTALIDFFTGRGVTGTSESFGARLLSIQEVR